jgi:hypothetical protein
MKRLFTYAIICITLLGCVPSENYIQTAIAETESSKPVNTIIEEPTLSLSVTLPPTDTPSITPSETPTLSPTVTPTDTPTITPTPDKRIILGNPEDYILLPIDIPDHYILQSGDSTPHLNQEILYVRGTEDGKAYLEATGRIGGWIIYYVLSDPTAIAPEWIRSYVVMYDKVDGPSIVISPEFEFPWEGAEIVNIEMDLGDWSLVQIKKERQPSGKNLVWYAIEFIYKNVWAEVMGKGFESDINHQYLENLARIMLQKLENAPLGNP